MGKYFGTDGFRGAANSTLTAEHAFKVGRFLGWYYTKQQGERAKIVIGKDTRRSGYMFEYALASGIASSGADAYLMHVTTTPSVAYCVRTEGFACGIMISASHNPFYDNGIKLFNAQGEKAEDALVELLEAYLDGKSPEIPYAQGEAIGRTVDFTAGRNRYIGYLVSLGLYSFKGWKVGLDCANGSAWNIAKSVFDALGATTFVLGAEPDGTNINAGVGSTHIEALQQFVVEKGLDIGFAYDGDADRCLCVDDKGNVVDGDGIMYLYARYMKAQGKLVNDTLVTTVMSNFGLYKALEKEGITCEKTAVGDRFVAERMREGGYMLGGEQSGHIIFAKYAGTGDGVLTSLKVMQAIIDKKTSLSKLVEPFEKYPQILKNARVKDKTLARKDEDVQTAVANVEKRLGTRGRILVRESGTEPLLRVMVEAETLAECEACVEEIFTVLQKNGHIVE